MINKRSKLIKKIMVTSTVIIVTIIISLLLYLRQGKFGKPPRGARLERMKLSPNFKNGKFHNLSPTPTLAEGHNWWDVLSQTYFRKNNRKHPTARLPSIKSDLLHQDAVPASGINKFYGYRRWKVTAFRAHKLMSSCTKKAPIESREPLYRLTPLSCNFYGGNGID
jgi:hypothetical protein